MDTEDQLSGVWRQRTDDLSWREMENEVIVLDLRTAAYLRLNASGVALWNRLEDGASLEDLGSCLAERFELDAVLARRDAAAFLNQALDKGLIEKL